MHRSMLIGLSLVSCGAAVVLVGVAGFAPVTEQSPDGTRRSVQKRVLEPTDRELVDPGPVRNPSGAAPVFPLHFRTIDGTFNNPTHEEWGAAETALLRVLPPAYPSAPGDTPARWDGPSVREVSNALSAQDALTPNSQGISDYLWQWGQFLDHDIDESPIASGEALDIPVPPGDEWFDPKNTGTQVIGMERSSFEIGPEGVREQLNAITSFIDASGVYGSDEARAQWLRAHDGTGMLKTSEGNLLPFNTDGFPNAPTADDPGMFLAGDVRANEQMGLTAMHILFVREHNNWCSVIRFWEPTLTGDEVYERARAIVGAEMQIITYKEFLPLLLGAGAIPPYQGFKPGVNPSVANIFSTAAYRVGHSMLSPTIRRLAATDLEAPEGDIELRDAFFRPDRIETEGIDSILRGLASQRSQTIDRFVVDEVRNFLFGPPGSGGFDLASLNMQRGRDHGLPDYNSVRAWAGLASVTEFKQINPDPDVYEALASVYTDVDSIDPWIGMLCEPPVPGAIVGPTMRAVLADQFRRLRDGDRFWYENYFDPQMVGLLEQQTLATIIRRNTGIGAELPDDVFMAQLPCAPDLNDDGVVTFADVSSFLAAFGNADPRVDYAAPFGQIGFPDVAAFLGLYTQGCP